MGIHLLKMLKVLLVLFLVVVSSSATNYQKQSRYIGKINFILGKPGTIKVKHYRSKNWLNAKLGMRVLNRDRITTTRETRCEILLQDGSVVRLGEKADFEFSDVYFSKNTKKVETELRKGRLWANIRKLAGKDKKWQVKAPTAVCAVRGTIYRIDASTSTDILVYEGEVDVGPTLKYQQEKQKSTKSLEPQEVPGPTEIPPPYEVTLEEWIRIVAGYQVIVREDGKYAKSKIDPDDAKLDWVKWNRKRDNVLK